MLLVGVGVAGAQQTTAIEAIQYYVLDILARAGVRTHSRQFLFLIFLGCVKVGVIVVAGRLFDHPRMGRRPLLIASNAGICACLLVLAAATSLRSVPLAVGALAGYMTFFSLGAGPGTWLVASEVFSLGVRARAMSLATCTNRGLAAVVSGVFLSLKRALGDEGFLLLFAFMAFGNALFMYFIVPETKGRSLEEMLAYFKAVSGDADELERPSEIECTTIEAAAESSRSKDMV
mmetsp:Transcript_14163/g.42208  ORF Transcript_14163/g.42208 Transcript_14163/m.42208 type:complete len:233 (+) Transcript_14163:1002-1700(+)